MADTTRSTSRRINRDEGSARPALDSDVEIRIVVEPAMHDSPCDCVDESMDSAVAEQLRTPSPVEVAHVYVPFLRTLSLPLTGTLPRPAPSCYLQSR